MKIVVLNGSPKGEFSITLQYLNYLKKKYPDHDFQVLHIAQKIKKIEEDENYFNELIDEIDSCDIVLWSFGLWVLVVSAQYMRFIELISERKAEFVFKDKYTAAISTSIQFYDHTAHNYIRAVSEDLKMNFVEGISFYILNLVKEKKRKDLITFFENLIQTVDKKLTTSKLFSPLTFNKFNYNPTNSDSKIKTDKNILVLTDNYNTGTNLRRMIDRFASAFQEKPVIIDLNDIEIKGACLG